jgi:hypothetical protein
MLPDDLSRSYPFLDLSRRMGISYGAVLRMSDRIDQQVRRYGSYKVQDLNLTNEQVRAVAEVCMASWRWQFPPQQTSGLNAK